MWLGTTHYFVTHCLKLDYSLCSSFRAKVCSEANMAKQPFHMKSQLDIVESQILIQGKKEKSIGSTTIV